MMRPVTIAAADFHVDERQLSRPLTIIAYGDMRFTDPKETDATNPKVRRLVDKIAAEKPDAVLLSGDIPWHGGTADDYAVCRAETKAWRDATLRVYPAEGNQEFSGGLERECLENWWRTFPELRGRRYYSVQAGNSIYVPNLDSDLPLASASEQMTWVKSRLDSMPLTVRFLLVNLHHPPVVDFQPDGDDSHNGRPNEAALANLLANAPQKSRVRFLVAGGRIHNYERFVRDGVVYIVSGGGGAKPRPVTRHEGDLYQDTGLPNHHFVRLKIDGARLQRTMVRVADPTATKPSWQENDRFEIGAP